MRKRLPVFALIAALLLISGGAAQTVKQDLFDLKKSQQELEIMRGILNTTLSFIAKEMRAREGVASTRSGDETLLRYSWGSSNLNAYYLQGMGAVFVVPVSNLRSIMGRGNFEYDFQGPQAEAYLLSTSAFDRARTTAALAAGVGVAGSGAGVAGGVKAGVVGGVPGGVAGGVVGGVPEGVAPVAPPATAVAPTPPSRARASSGPQTPASGRQESPEELRKRLAEAQSNILKNKEDTEQKRAKFLAQVAEIKTFLVEALANHGDSLTHVKANEQIVLILTSEDSYPMTAASAPIRSTREVLSVQKSTITDYKAGRLTLDQFKQKVLNYNN